MHYYLLPLPGVDAGAMCEKTSCNFETFQSPQGACWNLPGLLCQDIEQPFKIQKVFGKEIIDFHHQASISGIYYGPVNDIRLAAFNLINWNNQASSTIYYIHLTLMT